MTFLAKFPLRLTIPIALLFLALLIEGFTMRYNLRLADLEEEKAALALITQDVTQLQDSINYCLRKGDPEEVQAAIANRGSSKYVTGVVLVDDAGNIIASSSRLILGRSVQQAMPDLDQAMMREVGQTLTGRVALANDRRSITAYSPVILGSKAGEIRPRREGILCLSYDLSEAKGSRRHGAERQAFIMAAFYGCCFLLLGLFLHVMLTRRVGKLVATARQFAAGDLSAQAGFKGNDEFAQIGAAFDQMAKTIANDIVVREKAEAEIRQLNSELEKRVRTRTAHLEATLKELESVSYSIAHDLRTPLRSIAGFSQILLDDCDDKLDQEAKENLLKVKAASKRLGLLIDDMLMLTKVTRAEMRSSPVDLSALASRIASDLRAAHPERQVTIRIEPGLVAVADQHLIEVVLENLLGNAWKYTGRRTDACIEFGRTVTASGTAFFVRDDGAGFDPQFRDKLFRPFQRLHSNEEFPGTGIGLATVQRIIQRHGGQVWADGQPALGATFFFTLPDSGREDQFIYGI